MADIARIEERLDRIAIGNTPVSDSLGGIVFQNMTEVMEFSKLMSLSGNAVPKHLQGNPGMCLAVCIQAMEWRFSPFAVANKSYEVQNRLSFESQLVHAVIEQRAPIVGRLRHKFEGEGDARVCIVWAKLRETGEELEYRSPSFGKIQPKNSPLWKTKPDLQQYYNTSRDFCRAYFPDVLLGVYSEDELRDHVGPDNAKDVTKPDVASRLKGNKGRGFSAQHVERESRGGGVIEERATDAQSHPDRAETMGDDQQGGGHDPVAGKSSQAGETPATNSNSSEPDSPKVDAQTDTPAESPAPITSNSAGNPSETSAQSQPGADEGGTAVGDASAVPTLPVGWEITYSSALRRAQKPASLDKLAAQWWAQYGGWERHNDGPNATAAVAIYTAFKTHFGNREAIDAELREIF